VLPVLLVPPAAVLIVPAVVLIVPAVVPIVPAVVLIVPAAVLTLPAQQQTRGVLLRKSQLHTKSQCQENQRFVE